MKIIIDIPSGAYDELTTGTFPIQDAYRLVAWVMNGTKLPEVHGRLIDADALILDTEWSEYSDDFIAYSKMQIAEAPTIVEEDWGKFKG